MVHPFAVHAAAIEVIAAAVPLGVQVDAVQRDPVVLVDVRDLFQPLPIQKVQGVNIKFVLPSKDTNFGPASDQRK